MGELVVEFKKSWAKRVEDDEEANAKNNDAEIVP